MTLSTQFFIGILFLSRLLLAGGMEGSGGGGVACFENEATAMQVESILKATGSLNDPLRQKAVSVVTLEHFENSPQIFSSYEKWNDYQSILKDQQKFFEKHSPMFASRLKLVSKLIDLRKWEQNKKLPRIFDAHVKKEIPKNCRVVQLAVRYTRSIPGRLPEARVEVDEYFFKNKLDAYNQALLILHEQMYLIGKETGHEDSDEIRKTIALLVSENLRGYLVGAPNNAAASNVVQNLLNKIYGDYFRFFVEDPEDKPNFIPSGYTQYSRYLSFKSLLISLRNRKGNCQNENKFETLVEESKKKEIQEKCSYWAIHPDYIHTFTTNEEAFLFVTRWILDRQGLIDNSEIFVVWEKENPEFMTDYQKSELLKACREIKTRDYQYFRPVMAKAREYCGFIN